MTSVWYGPWPGIASIAVLPAGIADLSQVQQGYVDIASGRTLTFGSSTSETPYDRFRADGSPWVAGPSVDDPDVVLLADLRTFEARSLADVLGVPVPGAPVLVSTPANDGTVAVGFARTGSLGIYGGPYSSAVDGPDGILVLGSSYDDSVWLASSEALPFMSPMAVSPDGASLAVVSTQTTGAAENVVLNSYTFGLIDVDSGDLLAVSDSVTPFAAQPRILWAQNGASAVYLAGTTLQRLDVAGSGGPVAVLDAGETLEDVQLTWSPDVVIATERKDHGSDASPDQTAQDIVYSINLATGETHQFAGIDVSGMSGWTPQTGALVMYKWLDEPAERATYTVFDPVSGALIGEISDAPSFQYAIGSQTTVIGRSSVALSADGRVEVFTLSTQDMYVIRVGEDTSTMDHVPPPDGLLSENALAAMVFLSPDGTQLSLSGDGDESRTRYLTGLSDSPEGWTSIPNEIGAGPGSIIFMSGPVD